MRVRVFCDRCMKSLISEGLLCNVWVMVHAVSVGLRCMNHVPRMAVSNSFSQQEVETLSSLGTTASAGVSGK